MTTTAQDIDTAATRIAPHIRETPLWRLPSDALGLPRGTPAFEAWLKLEHLQLSGCFKARGMFNRLLANPIPASGVIAASGGNAGIATALAARALGARAEVFVPSVSSPAKRERLRALGAEVFVVGEVYAEALEACEARQRETGALMTHAYDQPEVVAGAGTLARELEAQLAAQSGAQWGGLPDAVLVSVGGGGLVAGIAAWFAGRSRVVALEPELAPTLYRARAAGAPIDVSVGGVAADSLGARRIGADRVGTRATARRAGRAADRRRDPRRPALPVDRAQARRRTRRRAAARGAAKRRGAAARGREDRADRLWCEPRPGHAELTRPACTS
jgi:threonine dehydratase